MNIKKINSKDFKIRLKQIFLRKNRISKYKKELQTLYGTKIDKDNNNHMKMLYDIWSHFYPKDNDIHDIDKKWRKPYNIKIILLLI